MSLIHLKLDRNRCNLYYCIVTAPREDTVGCSLTPLGHQVTEWQGVLQAWQTEISLCLTGFDTSILPICKDSLGWMFNKLDMNYDLLLDHSEINAIYLDKYEPCIKPLFNSCDSFKDGKLSNNEWCYCFQKPGGKVGSKARQPWAGSAAEI